MARKVFAHDLKMPLSVPVDVRGHPREANSASDVAFQQSFECSVATKKEELI